MNRHSATARITLLAGIGVGLAVATLSRLVGTSSCGPPDPFPHLAGGADCPSLVAEMALRVGIASGIATIVVVLIATGLSRTAMRMEEDRRTRALERLADE